MKFKVSSQIEPSQEGFLLTFYLGLFALVGISACVNMIKDWRESKLPPDEKLKKALEKMGGEWLEPNAYDEFPTKYGMSDEESDRQNGGHWGPNPDNSNPSLKAEGIRYAEFKTAVEKLQKLSRFLASVSDTDGVTKKFESVLTQTFKRGDFTYDDNKKPDGVAFKYVDAVFPKFEFYWDSDKCIKDMTQLFNKSRDDYKRIAAHVGDIINEKTDGASEQEMQDRVGYIKAAEMIRLIHESIVEKWYQNFDNLSEIDVAWIRSDD